MAVNGNLAMNQSDPRALSLDGRIVRYADLIPCRNAFIDTRTPGSQEKENFTIIGPGVAENPDQHVHIDLPHGFNIGGARQPPGATNSQHSHETAEVFVVHSGRWAFTLGPEGEDGLVELGAGDVISIPTRVFRGFTNVGDTTGFLFAVLGGDDPGRVTWAPSVFEAAQRFGLVLLESGRLIDTTVGQQVPLDETPMSPTSSDDVQALRTMTADELAACVVTDPATTAPSIEPFGEGSGISEQAIIGGACGPDALPAGQMAWDHGFHVRRIQLAPGAASAIYHRREPEVLMIHQGSIAIEWNGGSCVLGMGDVITVPIGMDHSMHNASDKPATVFAVRGGDQPAGWHCRER